ncbi:lipid A deacylase LpxR family protein [Oryzomonas sp.]|uniref:lipid A deacylase LpxR family protein n=1 Tax=Oryzomonas sp. TaxID=2855186 RepID=UPI0038D3D36B
MLRQTVYQFRIKALSALARLRLLNVLPVRFRRLNPRRLDFILDLKSVLLSILIVFICFSVSASLAEDQLPPQNAFSVRDENSALGGHDENYTNGISIALTRKGKGPLGGVWDLAGNTEGERFATYELTQLMFSPHNISRSNPDPTDHPYAGLLYLGITTHLQTEKSLHSLKLIAGLAGPDAFAGDVQKFVHRIEGYDDPQGWAYQIKNEPVVNLFYEYRRKYELTPQDSEVGIEMIPMGGAFLGNYLIQAETDAQCRIGYHLPDDFGTTVLRGSGYLPFPQADKARHAWGIYAFAGGGASLVARNLVLDGNTFAQSRSVNKRIFLPAGEFGASLWTQRFQATFSYVMWGKEYYGQQMRENYLSGLLSCFF